MARLTNKRLRKRMEALHLGFGTMGAITGTKAHRGSDISHDELNNLEASVAAVETAFDNEAAITFTPPARPSRYFGRTEQAANLFIKSLETRFAALTAVLAVLAIAPTSGAAAGGDAVTITGVGFKTGATATIGGEDVTDLRVVDSTTITGTSPAVSAGTYDVVVTNPDTTESTLAGAFTTS